MTGLEKVAPDRSGWEVKIVSASEFEFQSWPRTISDAVAWVHKIFTWFPDFDYLTITFFREGPCVAAEKDEENRLSCWHYEPEEETFGYMLKWQAGDAIIYNFVEHEHLPSQICELLNSGVKKNHVNHNHGQIEKGDTQFSL